MINYDKFKKSLKHLELQFDNYERAEDRPGLNNLDREALAESVIQRFETCYDTLWKHLKRYLNEELGLADIPTSPKPLFRQAAENNLLPSPVEQWLTYTDTRNDTAHDYNGEKAAGCLELIPDFLDDAIGLYQTLTGDSWE
jgi:nucleotidyltransferase substrate binding protein (TIGR01987 family)